MLSEYHNPNFTRGQPERVTFLERRSQVHESSSTTVQRKRSKRSEVSTTAGETQDSTEKRAAAKKTKKDTPVTGADGDQSSPDNDNSSTKSSGLSRQTEKARALRTQPAASSADHRAQKKHSAPVYQPVSAQKSVSPMYQQSGSERKSLRVEERLMYQCRPYYGHDGLEARYMRPSLAPPFSRHIAAPWHQTFHPCHPAQLYDRYYSPCASREDQLYPPFARYPPVPYPDNRYLPLGPPHIWDAAYTMNRRRAITMTGGLDEYSGQDFMGKKMGWPQKQSVSHFEQNLASPLVGHMVAPGAFHTWPHHQFSSPESRPGVQWRAMEFLGDTRSICTASNEFRSPVVAQGYDTAQAYRSSFGQSVVRQVNTGTYSQTNDFTESTPSCEASVKGDGIQTTQADVQKVTRDISDDSGVNDADYQEQTEELETAVSKNEGEVHDYSESLHIITDDAVDLPLDVAEETVITCNATSTAASDHCSPLAQHSSAEEKMLMDTLMNTSASFSPEDTTLHLQTENTGPESRHQYDQGVSMYTTCPSDALTSQTFPQQMADNFNTSQESPEGYKPARAWTYSDPAQTGTANGHCNGQDGSPHSWNLPASQQEGDTTKAESAVISTGHTPLSFGENGAAADAEKPPYQQNHVYALPKDTTDNEMDCPSTSSEAENGHLRAKVLVQREQRGELSQLSSTSVQELLSAALRTPGMKIMVDDNCHQENMVLVIPKGKRREVSGCV
ncbi:uncharacterized protein LOC143300606 [Babylonia areolata]|uniref:uncharacterized protein LOC143300606 n=1 Tax=Babylonia areolata TaxID=304850 RepID=UPI003FCF3620